jgi:hypothetical protein
MKCTPLRQSRSRLWKKTLTGFLFPWRPRLWRQVLIAAFLVSAAQAQSPKQLWVVQEPDEIVAYDLTTFTARRVLKVPRRLLEYPEYLSINARGQMLFLPPEGAQWANGGMASAPNRVWFWNGHEAKEWTLEATKRLGGSAGQPAVTETELQWFLSAGGDFLFCFENRFEKLTDGFGLERSVRSSSRVWRTDLDGGRLETIASLSSPGWCRCATGVCSETCAEWSFWVPEGIVDDFFLVTSFTPGQLGSTYHESTLYRRSGPRWQVKKLREPIQRPLAASEEGELLVAAVPDGGCCAWENEGDDQTLLVRNGKVSVLYDESDRYGNRSYDVSFFTADARIAPGNGLLAYTVVSTARRGGEIRLSSEGKDNAEELARVRKAIADLPAVEVVQLGIQPRSETVVRHAELVGWVSDREILVAQDGRLAVYDIRGTKRKGTTIRVRSAADAFLR